MTNEDAKQWIIDHMPPDDDTKQSRVMRVVINALEQKTDILDKITTEIKETSNKIRNSRNDNQCFFTEQDILEIIDKYKKDI